MIASQEHSCDRQFRCWLFLVIAFGLCLRLVYFSEDIGGSHTFRQAMVANQIDSLKRGPYPGPRLGFLERYDQVYDYGVRFYDTPVYQYLDARISDLLEIDAVKAGRLVNLLCYAGISLVFYLLLVEIGLGPPVALLTILLFAISPLSIQNFIGIYPDTLASFLAFLSFFLLLRYERRGSWSNFILALLLGFVCALIKSSICLIFFAAYVWNLAWTERARIFRRLDLMFFGFVMACSVVIFVLERSYFNYGALFSSAVHNSESLRLDWFLGSGSQRLDPALWIALRDRFIFEYMYPAFALFAVTGLGYSVWNLLRTRAEPYITISGLVVGCCLTILAFFYVIVNHDYYAIPFIPVYCVLTSVGIFWLYSMLPKTPRLSKGYLAIAAAAVSGSVYDGYHQRFLNYNWNKILILTGKSIQELVPENGYLFYFHGADYVDPEYLYFARRRGVLANIAKADNAMVAGIIREHKWDPNNTYVLANSTRLKPEDQETLKGKLSNYELREIGTSIDNGIVYKLVGKQ